MRTIKSMHTVTIYCLTRPGSDVPVYYGEAIKPRQRLRYHSKCDVSYVPISSWLSEIRKLGFAPTMTELSTVQGRTERSAKRKALAVESRLVRDACRDGIVVLNNVAFWKMHSHVPATIIAEFKSLLFRRYQRKHFRSTDPLWPDFMSEIEARLGEISSDWPSLNIGDYHRFNSCERVTSLASSNRTLRWGY